MATVKEIKVLLKIRELSLLKKGSIYDPVHYSLLIETIFIGEVINRYSLHKINKMACGYLGKMARKDYIQAAYNCVGNYAYFEGYYLTKNGLEIIKSKM